MAKNVDVTIRGKNETKGAFEQATANAKEFEGAVKKLTAPIDALKGAIAGLGAYMIGAFAKATVDSAAQADAAWGRVESAVTNLGISFQATQGQLDALFTKMQRTTRYSDDDAATAFARLVTVSGDYTGSVKNLSLAADLAANKQIELSDAADLVGKVMAGTGAKALKQFGIDIKDGADGIEELRKKVQGFAERDAGTLDGRLKQLAAGWDNVKEAIGRALVGDGGNDGLNALAQKLNDIGVWIDTHRSSFSEWARDFSLGVRMINDEFKKVPIVRFLGELDRRVKADVATIPGGDSETPEHGDAAYHNAMAATRARRQAAADAAADAAHAKAVAEAQKRADEIAAQLRDKRIADLKKEGDLLLHASDIVGLTMKDYQRLGQINGELLKIMHDQKEPLEVRAAAAEFIRKQEEATAEALKKSADLSNSIAGASTMRPGTTGVNPYGAGQTTSYGASGSLITFKPIEAAPLPTVQSPDQSFMGGFKTGASEAELQLRALEKSTRSLGETLGEVKNNAIDGFFSAWGDSIPEIIAGHEKLGNAVLKSARKAIGGAMVSEGQQALYKAALATAAGFTNPAEFVKAAKYLAIGSAEIAAGAAMAGAGGGGGGYGGGLSSGGFSSAQSDMQDRGKLTVVWPKGRKSVVDVNDADDRDSITKMLQSLAGTRDIEFIYDGA